MKYENTCARFSSNDKSYGVEGLMAKIAVDVEKSTLNWSRKQREYNSLSRSYYFSSKFHDRCENYKN